MSTFNNARLKELRKNACFTQLQMAEKIGVARTTYAEYEQGKIQPPIDKIQRICNTFGINTAELVNIENNTGVDVSNVHFKRKMSDEEKILRVSALQQKEKMFNTFSDMCLTLQELDFEEKAMLLPMLTYLRNKYALNERDMEVKRRIRSAELKRERILNND